MDSMFSLWDRIIWVHELTSVVGEIVYWYSILLMIVIVCKMLYLRVIKQDKTALGWQNIKKHFEENKAKMFNPIYALLTITNIVIILDHFRCQILIPLFIKILRFKILIDVIMSKIS